MDTTAFIPKLEETLEIAPGALRDEDEIRNFECWDSLKLIEILALVDEQCNVQLDANRLGECVTVQDILALIAASAEGKQ